MATRPCQGSNTQQVINPCPDSVETPCPGTTLSSVFTYVTAVATLTEPRTNALMVAFDDVWNTGNRYIVVLGGWNSLTGAWIGNYANVYDAATGTVTQLTFSTPLPEPTTTPPVGWETYEGLTLAYELNWSTNKLRVYDIFDPINYHYDIDMVTGQVDAYSTLYTNWSTPPETISQALVTSGGSPDTLLVIPDNAGGTRTNAFSFDTANNVWNTLTFDAVNSEVPEQFFAPHLPVFGVDGWDSHYVYSKNLSQAFVFAFSINNNTEYVTYQLFNGRDPFASVDSDGNVYSSFLAGTGIQYGIDETYIDGQTIPTDSGDGVVMFGGLRAPYTNKYVQRFSVLFDLNTNQESEVSDNILCWTCPRASAAVALAPYFNEENARGSIIVPPYVAADANTSYSDKIKILYFTGGVESETNTAYDATLYALVTDMIGVT